LFTSEVEGMSPHLDPAKPLSREHVERAAKEARISVEKIDEAVLFLSRHMGWDITKATMG
jgi:hypothetical protein